jgi:hypothetical protein
MFRQVLSISSITHHRVGENGEWIEDNSLLNDIGPGDDEASNWGWVEEVPEETARRLYYKHFAATSRARQGTVNSPPHDRPESDAFHAGLVR